MPRIRTIKPEFASDEKLARVSRNARLTFVLLVTQSDDDGLLPGRVRQLLGLLYPHDDDVGEVELSQWLHELERIGAVRWRETVDEAPVLELVNWSKHQKVDHKARSLILPNLKPLAELSRESREGIACSSRDSRAPTLDLGPTTEDQRPAAAGAPARVELARVANDAIDAVFGTAHRRPPLLAGQAAALLEVLEQDAIPLEFACDAIRDAVPALKEPPRSLAYFAPIVRDRWETRSSTQPPRRGGKPAAAGRVARNRAALAAGLAKLEGREVANG